MTPFTLPEAPGEPFAAPDDDADPNRRRTVLGLSALAVCALAAGGFLLLGSGPDDEALAVGVAPSAAVRASAGPSPASPPVPAPPPAASVQVDGRNPFAPLHGSAPRPDTPSTAPAVAPASGTGSGVGTGADVTDAAGPAVGPALPSGDGSGQGSGDPGSAGQGSGDQPGGDSSGDTATPPRTVGLRAVTGTGSARSAVLVVDGSPMTVAVGDSFGPGGTLQLVSVQEGPDDGQWTAVLRSGDADPFDVVSGVPTRLP